MNNRCQSRAIHVNKLWYVLVHAYRAAMSWHMLFHPYILWRLLAHARTRQSNCPSLLPEAREPSHAQTWSNTCLYGRYMETYGHSSHSDWCHILLGARETRMSWHMLLYAHIRKCVLDTCPESSKCICLFAGAEHTHIAWPSYIGARDMPSCLAS
jgi:hypothetical protein